MTIYLQLLMLMIITVFVVDFSGWTPTWKGWLKIWFSVEVGSVKPFDCSLCMTHHICLIYALCVGEFSLLIWAYICGLAALSKVAYLTMQTGYDLIETAVLMFDKLILKIQRRWN